MLPAFLAKVCFDGVSPSGKARDSESLTRGFESLHPSQYVHMKKNFFSSIFHLGIVLQCVLSAIYFGIALLNRSLSHESFAGTGVIGYVLVPILLSLVLFLISLKVEKKAFFISSIVLITVYALLTFIMGVLLLVVTVLPRF